MTSIRIKKKIRKQTTKRSTRSNLTLFCKQETKNVQDFLLGWNKTFSENAFNMKMKIHSTTHTHFHEIKEEMEMCAKDEHNQSQQKRRRKIIKHKSLTNLTFFCPISPTFFLFFNYVCFFSTIHRYR